MKIHNKTLLITGGTGSFGNAVLNRFLDTDHFKGLCKRFTINQIPTVLIIKDGYEIKRITGLVLTSAFRSTFADICSSES